MVAKGTGRRVMWGLEGLGGESKIKREVQGPLGWQIWWGMYALGVYGPKGLKYGKICTSFCCMAAVGTCRVLMVVPGPMVPGGGVMWM